MESVTPNNTTVNSNTLDSTSESKHELPPKPKDKKRPRQCSEVWDHYTRNETDPNDPRAVCKYCGKDYASNKKRNGTSTLWNHLNNQCKKYPFRLEEKRQKVLSFQKKIEGGMGNESVGSGSLLAVGFSQTACRQALAKMIVIDELSFRFVEQEGFRLFCNVACPMFDIPCRVTIRNDIKNLFKEEKKKLKKFFIESSQRVSLTTDSWTSIQNVVYMVLTAHFIDNDWKLQKRILNFCQIADHKGDTIGKAIESCLKEWGIERVFTITVDNASSNNGAVQHIKKRLQIWKTAVCDGDFLHVRCSAHILNLVVGDGLKEIDNSIAAVRNSVRYVRASPSRFSVFKGCVKNTCKEEKALVCLDVPTRWNSTYLMLDHALKYVDAFKLLEEEDISFIRYFCEQEKNGKKPFGPPNATDWEKCVTFCKFLKVFYDVTLKFSASLNVTSNVYFQELSLVHGLINKWCSSDKLHLKEMACKMKLKFDKYWGTTDKQNVLLYVATVLDPRYKLKFVAFCLRQLYSEADETIIMDSIKSCLSKLVAHYTSELKVEHVEGSSQVGMHSQEKMVDSDEEDSIMMFESEFDKECNQDDALDQQNELDRYLAERNEDRKNKSFAILEWWKCSSSKYPILSAMARDILAVQVSTVASESAFSTGGRVLDSFRSSLKPSMVEALICCQNWLRSTSVPLDLHSILEEFDDDTNIESGKSEVVNLT